jgi:hypothetical protein
MHMVPKRDRQWWSRELVGGALLADPLRKQQYVAPRPRLLLHLVPLGPQEVLARSNPVAHTVHLQAGWVVPSGDILQGGIQQRCWYVAVPKDPGSTAPPTSTSS